MSTSQNIKFLVLVIQQPTAGNLFVKLNDYVRLLQSAVCAVDVFVERIHENNKKNLL